MYVHAPTLFCSLEVTDTNFEGRTCCFAGPRLINTGAEQVSEATIIRSTHVQLKLLHIQYMETTTQLSYRLTPTHLTCEDEVELLRELPLLPEFSYLHRGKVRHLRAAWVCSYEPEWTNMWYAQ